MSDEKLIKQICLHEGYRQFAYKDSRGFITVGIGRCLERGHGEGISEAEALYLLSNDIAKCRTRLSKYEWWVKLNQVRKDAVVELVFNMGLEGVLSFVRMIASLSEGDYNGAAYHLIDSRWAIQVGANRSNDLAYRIKNGEYIS